MTIPPETPSAPLGDKPEPPLRIYTDTSVIGGCFDEQFAEYSNRLIEKVRAGRLRLLISDVVARELRGAPPQVQEVLNQFSPGQIESLVTDHRTFEVLPAFA